MMNDAQNSQVTSQYRCYLYELLLLAEDCVGTGYEVKKLLRAECI